MPTTTNYIWDEQNYLAETDGSNVVQTVYTNEPQQYGNLISTRPGSSSFYHHFDAIGSTRQVTNSAGTVTDTVTYDAWGNVVNRTGTTGARLLWIGQLEYYFDPETGLVIAGRRPYGPVTARWTTIDPLGFMGALLLYLYSDNSPTNTVDPSGLLRIRRPKGGISEGLVPGPAQGTAGPPPGALPPESGSGVVGPPPGAPGWFCRHLQKPWKPSYCIPAVKTSNCACNCASVMGDGPINADDINALASDVQTSMKLNKMRCKFTIIQGKCDMEKGSFFMCDRPSGGMKEFFICFSNNVSWCYVRAALHFLFTQMKNACNNDEARDCKKRAMPGFLALVKASDVENCKRRSDADVTVQAAGLADKMCAGQGAAPEGPAAGGGPPDEVAWDPIGGKTCSQWIEDNFPE